MSAICVLIRIHLLTTSFPRDVFYAANSWAHHVCHADPSPQLRNALAESEIPLALESSEDLPDVIAWLEVSRPWVSPTLLTPPGRDFL